MKNYSKETSEELDCLSKTDMEGIISKSS